MLNDPTDKCRVCGLEQAAPQYGPDGQEPSFDFCDCCGVEFGYGDMTLKGIQNHRNAWRAEGWNWHDPSKKPKTWSIEEQLKQVKACYHDSD